MGFVILLSVRDRVSSGTFPVFFSCLHCDDASTFISGILRDLESFIKLLIHVNVYPKGAKVVRIVDFGIGFAIVRSPENYRLIWGRFINHLELGRDR